MYAMCCCEVEGDVHAIGGQACGESVITAHSSSTGTCEMRRHHLQACTGQDDDDDDDENMQLL
jgi:hypothetical protein